MLANRKEGSEFKVLGEQDAPTNSFVIEPGKLYEAADHGIEILSDPCHGIFQQNGRLVRIISYQTGTKSKKGTEKTSRPEGALILQEADEIILVKILSQTAKWSKFDAKEKGSKPIENFLIVGRGIFYLIFIVKRGKRFLILADSYVVRQSAKMARYYSGQDTMNNPVYF